MLSDESKCGRDELDREERMYLPQSMELCQRLNTFKNEKKILTREIISFFLQSENVCSFAFLSIISESVRAF